MTGNMLLGAFMAGMFVAQAAVGAPGMFGYVIQFGFAGAWMYQVWDSRQERLRREKREDAKDKAWRSVVRSIDKRYVAALSGQTIPKLPKETDIPDEPSDEH